MSSVVLVFGDVDGGQLPPRQIFQTLKPALLHDEVFDFFAFLEVLLSLLVEPQDLDFAEVQLLDVDIVGDLV